MASPYRDLARPPLRLPTLTRALVREGSFWREVRVLEEVSSTNAVVEQAAQDGEPEGLVVVAELQTEGRGRLGRTWLSPPRAGLTFSVLLRPTTVPESRWSWLPLLAGVAVSDAVEQAARLEVRLKWPNDLLVGGRKVGGILTGRQAGAMVIGVGLNVTTAAAELPNDRATSLLLSEAETTDRETLLRASLRTLATAYQAWRDGAGDSDPVLAAYARRCSTLGSPVTVALPDGSTLRGLAARLDGDGRLVITADDGEHVLSSGDVVHLRDG